MTMPDFTLKRDTFGRLSLTTASGETIEDIVPVRAFPIAEPEIGIALVSPDGHEVGWINALTDLPEAMRQLLEGELASREFVPEINRIVAVSSFACPSTWQVATNRGDTSLILKGEEDIRRISQTRLLIADTHGIQFLIRDTGTLDRHSRKLLDRFL